MATIKEAKRLIKRVILSNIVSNKKDLAITPLISGKHGIGKSQMIKSIANDLNGACITIEGGTLKEGEITGLPYQYKDNDGNTKFRFLPYYAVERIQNEEKRLFELSKAKRKPDLLKGDENKYALNDIPNDQKIKMIQNGDVKLTILFIDEINRTENTVYKELMNILLTRSVNGYEFPWWVQFVGAMNPSTQNSVYSTNEMDPAQLDRFIKIKVTDNTKEWLEYGEKSKISSSILSFIKDNPKCLSLDSKNLEDEEKPEPSPRGWDMVDSLINSESYTRAFFTDEENDSKVVEKDMKTLVSSKLGSTVATMYFASLVNNSKAISAEDIFSDDEKLSKNKDNFKKLSVAKKNQTCDNIIRYLKDNVDFIALDKKKLEKNKKQLKVVLQLLDSSNKLLFAQKIVSENTQDGKNLIDYLYDILSDDVISLLDISDSIKNKLKGSK